MAAARMAVPSMGLVYDPKVDSYLKELDLPAAGRVDSFNAQEAIRRADALMADYPAVLSRLKEKSAAMTAPQVKTSACCWRCWRSTGSTEYQSVPRLIRGTLLLFLAPVLFYKNRNTLPLFS